MLRNDSVSITNRRDEFIQFLKHDLDIPSESINTALKQSYGSINSLPILLWQYGFVSLKQLEHIFSWLERH